jgi:hypothetical protein
MVIANGINQFIREFPALGYQLADLCVIEGVEQPLGLSETQALRFYAVENFYVLIRITLQKQQLPQIVHQAGQKSGRNLAGKQPLRKLLGDQRGSDIIGP